jgi:hypothetical protein
MRNLVIVRHTPLHDKLEPIFNFLRNTSGAAKTIYAPFLFFSIAAILPV